MGEKSRQLELEAAELIAKEGGGEKKEKTGEKGEGQRERREERVEGEGEKRERRTCYSGRAVYTNS